MMRETLLALTSRLPPPRVIYDRDGRSPYLSRWYLTGRPTMPDGSEPFDAFGAPRNGVVWDARPSALRMAGVAVYLHRFHRSDEAIEMHSHPWKWAVSLMLAGGYSEERRRGQFVVRRDVMPGALNVITSDTYHRVDLLESDAWSLFMVGPKVSSWGFWDRFTGDVVPWRNYIATRRCVRSDGSRAESFGIKLIGSIRDQRREMPGYDTIPTSQAEPDGA